VDEHPAPLVLTPDFRYPVILALARCEVRAEAAACAGRDALIAQQGDEQYGKVAAVAEDPLAQWPGDGERARVQLTDAVQQMPCRTQLEFRPARRDLRFGHAVSVRPEDVHHDALHDLAQLADVV